MWESGARTAATSREEGEHVGPSRPSRCPGAARADRAASRGSRVPRRAGRGGGVRAARRHVADPAGTAIHPRAGPARLARHGHPDEYGGQGRGYLERFVVTEELLVVGAPVAAHWIAERQIGPSLLRYGTEEQKQAFLPGIAAGRVFFGIGMSEPDSGSDLASVRTRAERSTAAGCSPARRCGPPGRTRRTPSSRSPAPAPLDPAHRHEGLSQFIVDLRAPGSDDPPDLSMGGEHHFNEVHPRRGVRPRRPGARRGRRRLAQVTSELALRAQRPRTLPVDLPAPREPPRRPWTRGACPPTRVSAVTSRASRPCTTCRSPCPRRSRTTRTPTPPLRSSRCSARRARATSPTTSTP